MTQDVTKDKLKKSWDDIRRQEQSERSTEVMNRNWENEEFRQAHLERNAERNADPAFRAHNAETTRQQHLDPAFVKKRTAAVSKAKSIPVDINYEGGRVETYPSFVVASNETGIHKDALQRLAKSGKPRPQDGIISVVKRKKPDSE